MRILNRRDFVKTSAAMTAAAALASAETTPNMKFPTAPRDRLAVASYPFRAFIDSPRGWDRDKTKPGMDLKEFPAMIVEKFNIRNIEPLGEHFRSTDDAYVHEVRAAVEKAGAHIINIPTNVKGSLYDPDPAKRKVAVAGGKRWVDIAVMVGSPSLRIHIAGVKSVAPNVDRAAESLKEIAEHGALKNIMVNLENDDPATEDAFFIVKVIEKANSPWLRALPDFCNSMLKGDEKFNYDAVTAMFKHAYNISHVKDSEVDNHKVFRVDMAKTFAIAKASGYRGYFSMEFEGEGEPYEGTRKLLDESLKNL